MSFSSCMIEGKESSQAMFLPSASSSIQKFRMAAFVFSSGSASQVHSASMTATGILEKLSLIKAG